MVLSPTCPLHPTWASLSQLLMMRMSQFKFSIPSLDHITLVMTLCNIENLFYFNFWSHNVKYLTRKSHGKLQNMFCPPNYKVFNFNWSHYQYNYNSFFNVDTIASSFDIIYPKNKSSNSITMSWSTDVRLTRF